MFPQGLYSMPVTPTDEQFRQLFYNRARWSLKFCWLPKRCLISNKRIWLKFAYQGQAVWHGPGDPAFEYHWHDKVEHIIWQLKQN